MRELFQYKKVMDRNFFLSTIHQFNLPSYQEWGSTQKGTDLGEEWDFMIAY